MLFDFGTKSSILLIFFVQGIIFSFLLFKKGIQNENRSSKWLSIFIFLCTMYIAPFMLGYASWYSQKVYRDILFFVPFQQLFLIGPILYFFTQSLLNKSFELTKRDWIHFIPAIAYLIYSLVIVITDKLILSEYYFYADGRDKDLAPWYQMMGLVSMVFYLIISLKYYYRYKRIAFDAVSFANSILFKWLKHFFIAFLLILILRVVFFILNPEWGEFGSKFWYYLCFSILFYFIALNGYFNTIKTSLHINELQIDLQSRSQNDVKPVETTIPNLDEWKSKIERLMQSERLYKNPSLTLSDIASALDTQPKTISRIVNQGFSMNFNDFINHYRIEAVIEQLKSGEQKTKTFLGIALDCGFNSKATFNRAFKKNTSVSPKQFLDKLS